MTNLKIFNADQGLAGFDPAESSELSRRKNYLPENVGILLYETGDVERWKKKDQQLPVLLANEEFRVNSGYIAELMVTPDAVVNSGDPKFECIVDKRVAKAKGLTSFQCLNDMERASDGSFPKFKVLRTLPKAMPIEEVQKYEPRRIEVYERLLGANIDTLAKQGYEYLPHWREVVTPSLRFDTQIKTCIVEII